MVYVMSSVKRDDDDDAALVGPGLASATAGRWAVQLGRGKSRLYKAQVREISGVRDRR